MNKHEIEARFSGAIETYNKEAIVQKKMAEILIFQAAKHIKEKKRVFEIGSGSGILTCLINSLINPLELIANDISTVSKQSLNKICRITDFIEGDVETAILPKNCDVIFSNAVFQWIEKPDLLFEKILNSLNSGGILAFSTFGKANYKELKSFGYGLESYMSIDEVKSRLNIKYDIVFANEINEVLYFNNSFELLKHISDTGVNGFNKPIGFRKTKELLKNYEKEFMYNGKVPLTYQSQFFIARKKQ